MSLFCEFFFFGMYEFILIKIFFLINIFFLFFRGGWVGVEGFESEGWVVGQGGRGV